MRGASICRAASRSACGRLFFLSLLLPLAVCSTSLAAPAKVRIHIPSKSLSVMPYYFGQDKGFFPREVVNVELIAMAPPIAIAALVAGELDFSTTLGAATSAIMQGH